ncbi:MAG: DNA cytosine methyltransferase [Verrucomicrobiae bacterium]|nr:DNA cytosine methyltransferase [Verrucomicrobiae bacterium]
MNHKIHNVIDLFCGCGGFGLGAHMAGFNPLLAVDIDKTLSSSYILNFPNTALKHYDLAAIESSVLLNDIGTSDITGIIGGPPCQGFSMMGKREENDPRNELIGHFFRHVKNIKPDFFIMENVPGLLSGPMRDKLEKHLKRASEEYSIIGPFIVDSSKLGAATKRERVIVIGYNGKAVRNFSEKDILSLHTNELVTVRDAIADLPGPVICEDGSYGWAKIDGRRKLSEYALKAKTTIEGCGWEIALEKLQNKYVSGLMDTVHTEKVRRRYEAVEPGKSDAVSKSVKLKWEGQAPTLRAGTGSDKGSYQAVRPLHPDQGRVITVREAARLQGFPDWFVFHPTKWHSFRMIGNSVSPHLSSTILSFINSMLIEEEPITVTNKAA